MQLFGPELMETYLRVSSANEVDYARSKTIFTVFLPRDPFTLDANTLERSKKMT